MPNPYRRQTEDRDEGFQPGLRVTTAEGGVYFFPGSTPQAADVIARLNLGAALDDPDCRIEFGTRRLGALNVWSCTQVVKPGRSDASHPDL